MKVLRLGLVPRTCALARPCRTDEPNGALGTSVAPNFRQHLHNGHALSGKEPESRLFWTLAFAGVTITPVA
jgi:hypothetical protein